MSFDESTDRSIPLVRAKHVITYIDWLRKLGTPVDRELRRARLPVLIDEMPEQFICHDLAYRFLDNCVRREGIDDIGFEAGWTLTRQDFGESMNRALNQPPTLNSRIECFARLIRQEDTGMRCGMHREGEMTRIWIHQYVPVGGDKRIAEWQNLKAVIEILRQKAGPDWLPPAIGFESSLTPSQSVCDRLSSVELCSYQDESWIEVPSRLLSQPITTRSVEATEDASIGSAADETENRPGSGWIDDLSNALIPYLSSGHPPIDLAAEMAGTSVRSLQRKLHRMKTSYVELVERIRFDQAVRLMRDSNLNILDIALTLGYRDASNFSRAIRRISGTSPSQLRRALLQ